MLTLIDRFWTKVNKSPGLGPKGDCWEWTSSISKGYGQLGAGGRQGRNLRAHRFSWELHYGNIPLDKVVCHKCDNPPCVRPEHLFLGTRAENRKDMFFKGRGNIPFGIRNGNSKLTEFKVKVIKEEVDRETNRKFLCELFGITNGLIAKIIHKKVWSYVQ